MWVFPSFTPDYTIWALMSCWCWLPDVETSYIPYCLRNRRWLGWSGLVDFFRYIYLICYLSFGILWLNLIEWECVMILIGLECGDLIRCIRTFVISVIEIHIYWWWFTILDTLTWIDTWRSGWLLRLGSWWLLRSTIVICSTDIWDIDQF